MWSGRVSIATLGACERRHNRRCAGDATGLFFRYFPCLDTRFLKCGWRKDYDYIRNAMSVRFCLLQHSSVGTKSITSATYKWEIVHTHYLGNGWLFYYFRVLHPLLMHIAPPMLSCVVFRLAGDKKRKETTREASTSKNVDQTSGVVPIAWRQPQDRDAFPRHIFSSCTKDMLSLYILFRFIYAPPTMCLILYYCSS
ncbi:hypothetical protein Y032_0221g2586 [Ancylostoma ceylanicum]|uniref:Uncharacterized protein n=1 Tax=Ancylostoma ceylanicum TaxID=53326 RepID=A0A016SJ17_9BILA|nr:hypothetical protein Y032_0221g2586 [Ancylostoma ceylanicum]